MLLLINTFSSILESNPIQEIGNEGKTFYLEFLISLLNFTQLVLAKNEFYFIKEDLTNIHLLHVPSMILFKDFVNKREFCFANNEDLGNMFHRKFVVLLINTIFG